jgi:hypothetical protein
VKENLALLFALLALSCKDPGVSPTSQGIGEVVLEVEFTNWAWGFQYLGMAIYENGNAYTYNPGKDTMTVLHHIDEFYTGTELRAKYAHNQVFIRTVGSDTVSLIRRRSRVPRPTERYESVMSVVRAGSPVRPARKPAGGGLSNSEL